jgi:MFS family permease
MSEPQAKPLSEPATPLAYECPNVERPASSSPPESALECETPGGIAAQHDPYAALRVRDFRIYLAGWICSVIGQQILDVAVGWDIFQRTSREKNLDPLLSLGLIGAVLAIPIIVLAIPAGVLADRFDRRRIITLSLIGAACCWLVLGWLSYVHGPLALMYLCLFVGATCSAMGWPARSALLPQLVPEKIFANAVTWNSSTFQIASMVGPALGGLILYFSTPLAYLFVSGFLLTFAVSVNAVNVKAVQRQREPLTLRSVGAGLRFVYRNKIILATITLDLFAVLLGGATALLPAFAKILNVQSGGFGLLRAAPGLGALIMGLIIAHLPPMKKAGLNLLLAVAGFGVATIIFGLSHHFILSFIMLALTGAFDNVSVIVRHTLVQVLTPNAMRGRVSAVNNIFVGASNELGGFESGLTGKWLGAVGSVVLGGIGAIGVVAAVALIWPQVRRFGSLEEAKAIEDTDGDGRKSAA